MARKKSKYARMCSLFRYLEFLWEMEERINNWLDHELVLSAITETQGKLKMLALAYPDIEYRAFVTHVDMRNAQYVGGYDLDYELGLWPLKHMQFPARYRRKGLSQFFKGRPEPFGIPINYKDW